MYRVGDIVRVRNDLKRGVYYCDETNTYRDVVNDDMLRLAGKDVTIRSVGNGYYRIDGDKWFWYAEMFSGYADSFCCITPIPESELSKILL